MTTETERRAAYNTGDDEQLAAVTAQRDRLAEAARYALGKLEALCRTGATQPGLAEEQLRAALAGLD
jgi:hypothetical protein